MNSHSPFFYSDHIYRMLNNALDIGIAEAEFWEMTLAELDRLAASKARVAKIEQKEKAIFDYIHASLVGKAVSMTMSSNATFPTFYEAYGSIFDEEAKAQEEAIVEKQDQLSALRFKQFAKAYNNKNKEVKHSNE